MQNTFEQAMDFRHACKVFDESKKINDDDMRYILEAGRKSPSSFGMELWKFLVITNEELKAKIRPFCWDQPQITTCSHLVILLCDIQNARVESGIPAQRFARSKKDKQKQELYLGIYANHLKDILSTDEKTYAWTSKQAYLAAANMMTAAAVKGIDSCPIEGFSKEEVEKVLGLDTKKQQLALVLPFGYRINPQSEQLRKKFDDVVEFIR
ncbi:NAD(P)H-dependent oxidoreductase [Campylobacter pinnipediorum]|uniref:NAD(P)H-dependent oxidoreductase n=1 Tax=Campylobacter pinnipediorum TaxID=1965231 RepID=UPI00084DE46E|nr:NAD(P)H-dependent oxidoreductase [Campylobacter pinnipediorum]OPA74489.1 NAD(P)H-dependent oxidoreductase [Campylobacter pinnipediorum subsp. pinnipediorum]